MQYLKAEQDLITKLNFMQPIIFSLLAWNFVGFLIMSGIFLKNFAVVLLSVVRYYSFPTIMHLKIVSSKNSF